MWPLEYLGENFITLNAYVRNKDRKSVNWAINSESQRGKKKNPKERIKENREQRNKREGPQTLKWFFLKPNKSSGERTGDQRLREIGTYQVYIKWVLLGLLTPLGLWFTKSLKVKAGRTLEITED